MCTIVKDNQVSRPNAVVSVKRTKIMLSVGSVAFSLEQVRQAQFALHGRSVYNHF